MTDNRTRTEHITWAKNRALELVEANDIAGALASFGSDVTKHTETKTTKMMSIIGQGHRLYMTGSLNTQAKMRDWINGFN